MGNSKWKNAVKPPRPSGTPPGEGNGKLQNGKIVGVQNENGKMKMAKCRNVKE